MVKTSKGAAGRKGSFWVGDCYKLHWVLRLQDPCLGLGLSHWAVGAAAAILVGLHTCLQSNPEGEQSGQV